MLTQEERDEDDLATHSQKGKKKGEKEKKKKKKSKEEKQKNGGEGLKRPLSAYMLFNNHRRPILKKEHPGKYNL